MIQLLHEDIDAVKRQPEFSGIDDDMFMRLIALDPTYRDGSNSVGKYGKWILRLFKKGEISEELFDDIPTLLRQFKTYNNRFKNKDINAYKTVADLATAIDEVVDDDTMLTDRQRLRFLKNVKAGRITLPAEDNYDTLYNSAQFIMWSPNTHEASMKLGKGTRWCTAHENPDWYNRYTRDDSRLYIIKDKETGRRYQFCDGTGDLLDDSDGYFDWFSVFSKDDTFYKVLAHKFPNKFPYVEKDADGWLICTSLSNMPPAIINAALKVRIPYGETVIADDAFANSSITNVDIPDTITSIGHGSFRACRYLQSITIPDSVEYIGNYAFDGCTNLVDVDLPNKDIAFGTGAFSHTGIKSITDLIKGSDIPKRMFIGCEQLHEIIIPEGVTTIGDSAFSGVVSATVELPSTLTTIGFRAFYENTALKKITIPDGVTDIGNSAFSRTSLTSVDIPRSVVHLRGKAFSECPSLKQVRVSGSYTTQDGVQSLSDVFTDCSKLQTVIIDSKIDSIDGYAFENCTELKSITLPDTVRIIGDDAFAKCRSLTEMILPDGIEIIGVGAFGRCINIKNVYLGNSLTLLESGAFYDCVGLTSVRIPSTVTKIGARAFKGCSYLKDIYISSADIQINEDAFTDCSPQLVVHTSSKVVKDYCRAHRIKTAPLRESLNMKLNIQE